MYIKYIKVASHIANMEQTYFLGFSACLQLKVQSWNISKPRQRNWLIRLKMCSFLDTVEYMIIV